MNLRRANLAWPVWALMCVMAAVASRPAHAEGSISFNGSTSELQNDSADVLQGSNELTICAWIYPSGAGELGLGTALVLDEAASGIRLQNASGSKLEFRAEFSTTPEIWSIPRTDNAWSAGIEAKTNLNNTTIIAHIKHLGGGIGVDLLDGTTDRIGNGNTIWITYDTEAGDMTATEALQLHSDWNPSNSPAGDTNDVRINGVRYYK